MCHAIMKTCPTLLAATSSIKLGHNSQTTRQNDRQEMFDYHTAPSFEVFVKYSRRLQLRVVDIMVGKQSLCDCLTNRIYCI